MNNTPPPYSSPLIRTSSRLRNVFRYSSEYAERYSSEYAELRTEYPSPERGDTEDSLILSHVQTPSHSAAYPRPPSPSAELRTEYPSPERGDTEESFILSHVQTPSHSAAYPRPPPPSLPPLRRPTNGAPSTWHRFCDILMSFLRTAFTGSSGMLFCPLVGVAAGIILREWKLSKGVHTWLAFPGLLYVRSLQALVAPLLFTNMTLAVVTLVTLRHKTIGIMSLVFFLLTSFLAATQGAFWGMVFKDSFTVSNMTRDATTELMNSRVPVFSLRCQNGNFLMQSETTNANEEEDDGPETETAWMAYSLSCNSTSINNESRFTAVDFNDKLVFLNRTKQTVYALGEESWQDHSFRLLHSAIPDNVVTMLSKGNLLALMFFALVFGLTMGIHQVVPPSKMPEEGETMEASLLVSPGKSKRQEDVCEDDDRKNDEENDDDEQSDDEEEEEEEENDHDEENDEDEEDTMDVTPEVVDRQLLHHHLDLELPDLVFETIKELDSMLIYILTLVLNATPVTIIFMITQMIASEMDDWLNLFNTSLFFILAVLLAHAIHLCVVLPLLHYIIHQTWPYLMMRKCVPAAVFAFMSSSSEKTLPVTHHCLISTHAASPELTHCVLTLGASMHMNGLALYLPLASFFLLQTSGKGDAIDLYELLLTVIVSTFASLASPPVRQGGLLVFLALFETIAGTSLPLLFPILLVLDKSLDRFQTVTNVLGDAYVTLLLAPLVEQDTEGTGTPESTQKRTTYEGGRLTLDEEKTLQNDDGGWHSIHEYEQSPYNSSSTPTTQASYYLNSLSFDH